LTYESGAVTFFLDPGGGAGYAVLHTRDQAAQQGLSAVARPYFLGADAISIYEEGAGGGGVTRRCWLTASAATRDFFDAVRDLLRAGYVLV
jgi:hypothetical protein